jgi:hypothetical protein
VVSLLLLLQFPSSCLPQTKDSQGQPPTFSEYHVALLHRGKNATPKITDNWRLFRTRIREASKRPPNFAGAYRIVEWGCGSDCVRFALVDLRSGSIYDPPFGSLWLDAYHTNGWRGSGFEYRANSRLLVADGCVAENCATFYYEWTGTAFRPISVTSAEHEQTFFGEGTALQHPVPVSPAVLKVLLRTTAAKQGLDFASVKQEDPAKMFRAAEIHLSNAKETDLIVLGQDWMTGADNDWFWLIGSANKNPHVVLFVGGNSVELKHSVTNGYRDITSHFYTAQDANVSVYRYNGRRYVRTKDEWTPNLPD